MATQVETSLPARRLPKTASNAVWNLLPFVIFFIAYLFAPRFAKETQLTALIYIGINVLLVVGLNLLMGYTGQISLGHAAFFGLGAYASAILTVRPVPAESIPGLSVGLGVMMGCAVLISLTRAVGWKLALGVAALIVFSWIARLTHLPPVAVIAVYAVGMALYGLVTKLGWWKCGLAGLSAALLMALSNHFLSGVLERGSASPWTAMVVGMFLTGLIAYLIGGQVLRLRGHYLAMGTLGFGIIVEIVFRQWTAVTGGSSDGIFGIPTIEYFDKLPKFLQHTLERAAGHSLDAQQQYYYLVWAFVFVALILAVNIVRSRVGRAFRAVHGSELAAQSLGVDADRYKVQVFVFSAAMASVAGSLYAHNAGIGYINPSEFGFMVSVQLVVMVVVGGLASVWGSLFGATAIQLLKNYLLTIEKSEIHLWGITLKGLEPIVFGAMLIIVMMIVPQGLVRGVKDAASALWRTAIGLSKRKAE